MTQPSTEKSLAMIALFTALIAALGFIPQVTLPFGIPVTAQSLGVMMCGAVLGSMRSLLAVFLFLLLVAFGLPILSGGRGGLGVFIGPTAGFLIGFPVAALVTGLIVENWKTLPLFPCTFLASVVGGIIVLYGFGIYGMTLVLDKTIKEAIALVIIFIPGDLIKAVVVGLMVNALYKARPRSILTR